MFDGTHFLYFRGYNPDLSANGGRFSASAESTKFSKEESNNALVGFSNLVSLQFERDDFCSLMNFDSFISTNSKRKQI